MSLLGAMCLFKTSQNNKPGLGCFFYNFIYENTKSQGAPELMAGFDCLKTELLSQNFKQVTNGKTFSKISLFTDNALNDSSHSPFIMQQNSQQNSLQIQTWDNNEAQVS